MKQKREVKEFSDGILLQMHRQFSNDELVGLLRKENKFKDGVISSLTAELEDTSSAFNVSMFSFQKEKEELLKTFKEQLATKEAELKMYRSEDVSPEKKEKYQKALLAKDKLISEACNRYKESEAKYKALRDSFLILYPGDMVFDPNGTICDLGEVHTIYKDDEGVINATVIFKDRRENFPVNNLNVCK